MSEESMAASPPLPLSRPWHRAAAALLAQRGRLLLWVPVCLSFGIGTWFALSFEPGAGIYWACAAGVLVCVLVAQLTGEAASPLFLALALVVAGFGLAGLRAHAAAEPVLTFRYYGPIEGRIVNIDRSSSDKQRLTLDRVVLEDMAVDRMPTRVRVSLHGDQGFVDPEPGLTVILSGHLSPPNGPVEPGGFDFRRMAWFQGLGAVGYTRTPVLVLAPAEEGHAGLAVFRLRMAISTWVQARIPGAAGGFAAAILTGDRSGVPRDVLESLRNSNMAHLLAISGLHMGLLTGTVFSALRFGLALVPRLALRYPIKKVAAMGALSVGAVYLALSGFSVSTQRAFIMVSVMLTAVLLERRAISLRSVAIAATILLVLSPEALTGPGFQMSFAATTALVAVFGWLRDHRGQLPRPPRWMTPVLAVVMSSAVAGAATGPFGAAHFNRIADYGLVANLLSVPVMGALVMPAAVMTAVLWLFGLADLGLLLMRLGLEWILLVARKVAGMEGAVTHVISPGPWVLPLMTLGFLIYILWNGRLRYLGLLGLVVGPLLWTQAERPMILIADTGGMVGVMGPEGRALAKPRGDGFAAMNWLENDGDDADQPTAASRPGFTGEKGNLRVEIAGMTLRHLTGKGGRERLGRTCGPEIVVLNTVVDRAPEGPCRVLDLAALRRSGAVAVSPNGGDMITVAETTGPRLWTSAYRRQIAARGQ